jgi:hypothetical protein
MQSPWRIVWPRIHRSGVLGEAARGKKREADMERTDRLDEGLDSGQARFLMVTAITHHCFSSPLWGGDEVPKLHAELAESELAAAPLAMAHARARSPVGRSFAENVGALGRSE